MDLGNRSLKIKDHVVIRKDF